METRRIVACVAPTAFDARWRSMKRDMDLIRTIILSLEAIPEAELNLTELTLEGQNDEVILEHLILLQEAGFIDMNVERFGAAPPEFLVHRITGEGHEFLETVRSDTIWAKSTKFITSAGLGLAVPLLQAVLRAKAAEHLGIQI
jgi:hypothetical protein